MGKSLEELTELKDKKFCEDCDSEISVTRYGIKCTSGNREWLLCKICFRKWLAE